MKKILSSLAVLALCSTSALAQDVVSGVAFRAIGNEVDDIELKSVDSKIEITLENYNPDTGFKPYLMVATGGGFEVGQESFELETSLIPETQNYKCLFQMNKETWGNPYLGNYQATLMVYFEDEDGEYLLSDEYEPILFMQSYITPNVFPAELVSFYPNNNWNHETFADAYQRGILDVNFSNIISLKENEEIGIILYDCLDGELNEVSIVNGKNAEADWNYLDGSFTLSIYYSLDGVDANKINEIDFIFNDLKSIGSLIEIEPIVLTNTNPNVKRLNQKAVAKNGLVSNDEMFPVYNCAGVLIKDNVNMDELYALPKGLYIVNGTKVVVK